MYEYPIFCYGKCIILQITVELQNHMIFIIIYYIIMYYAV